MVLTVNLCAVSEETNMSFLKTYEGSSQAAPLLSMQYCVLSDPYPVGGRGGSNTVITTGERDYSQRSLGPATSDIFVLFLQGYCVLLNQKFHHPSLIQ